MNFINQNLRKSGTSIQHRLLGPNRDKNVEKSMKDIIWQIKRFQ